MTIEADEPAADVAPGETSMADLDDALAFLSGKGGSDATTVRADDDTAAVPAPVEDDHQQDAPARDERGRFVSKETPAGDETTEDLWADAAEPLRTAYQTMETDRDSFRTKFDRARGEISRLTKELNKARTAPPPAAASAPKFESIDAAIATLTEDFPDLAKHLAPFADGMKALHGQLQPVQQRMAQQDTLDAETAEAAQEEILTSRHPDAREFLARNGLALRDWAASQAVWVSQIVEGNWDKLIDGEGVAEVISRFRASQETAADSPPQPAAQAAPRTDTRRDRQLAGAVTPPPSPRSTVTASGATGAAKDLDDALKWVNANVRR